MVSSSDGIPDDLKQFLLQYIDSVELLQVLLLLHSQPRRQWSIRDIEIELRSSQSAIEKRVSDLYQRKILLRGDSPERHAYLAADAGIAQAIDSLSEFYKQRPGRVVQFIYSRPVEAIRTFADAFKIKKDNKP